uniref:Large ribosomal subunit protein uL23c n=1 Tax=Boodleopsis pusilla TaxID=381415 RepID=A0A386AZL0_9CHLO|nr:ribosomal protein L23 [Boodleopsis pusilla]AYC64871.1 ribosomal protein L23 [Boodleopsis pusilla]
MISQKKSQKLVDFLKKPILTEKTTKFLERKHYTFEVDVHLTKTQIKQVFEQYYGIKIQSIQTHRVHSLSRPRKRVQLHFVESISLLSE